MVILVVILAIVALVAIGVVVWLLQRQRQSTALREQFGPEYDRTLSATGDRRSAEADLTARQERVEQLHIRPLDPADEAALAGEWRTAQARFVDDPAGAVGDADALIGRVMQARGYPIGDFEARAADLSVDHPRVVSNYRAAHRIAQASANGQAGTEQLRQAFVHYRALFDELLETRQEVQR